jgi:hypothetical protein
MVFIEGKGTRAVLAQVGNDRQALLLPVGSNNMNNTSRIGLSIRLGREVNAQSPEAVQSFPVRGVRINALPTTLSSLD